MSEEANKKDFLGECEHFFGSRSLYEVLGVEEDAGEAEIKSAYRKKSLKVHPDRAPEDRKEHAKQAFQTLTKVHVILTTENLRKVYDETGMVLTDEDSFASFSSFEEIEKYWRQIFPKISAKQIEDYLAKYVGSEEEVEDLKKLYIRFEGDLNMIYEYHYAYNEDRVVDTYNILLKKKEIPEFSAFVDEPKSKKQKRLKKIEKEAKEAEKEVKKMNNKKNKKRNNDEEDEDEDNDGGSLADLQLAIQNKNRCNFDNLLSGLEAKYGNPKKNGAGKKGKGGGKNKKQRNK